MNLKEIVRDCAGFEGLGDNPVKESSWIFRVWFLISMGEREDTHIKEAL